MNDLKCPEIDYEKYAEILKALGHPVRLKIAAGVMCNKCSVNDIVAHLLLPQSTVSQHLGVLRHAGILYPEKHGVSVCYRISNQKAADIIKILTAN